MIILLDIDNTLYSFETSGFQSCLHERIIAFAANKLNISLEESERLCRQYYGSYGLSLHGFHKHDGIDPKEYCDYVHQCDYSVLRPDPVLRKTIEDFKSTSESHFGGPHDVYYLTNADETHAKAVLEPLGLWDLFYGTPSSPTANVAPDQAPHVLGFSYEDLWRLSSPKCANKPMREAYEGVFQALRAGDSEKGVFLGAHPNLQPEEVVMVDDSVMNVQTPLALGWKAIWVGYGKPAPPELEAYVTSNDLVVISDISELGSAIGKLSKTVEEWKKTHKHVESEA